MTPNLFFLSFLTDEEVEARGRGYISSTVPVTDSVTQPHLF